MNIISDLNLYKSAFKSKIDKDSFEYLSIYNQPNNNLILSKDYLNIIEKEVENTELWKSIFTEMIDTGRIKKIDTNSFNPDEICLELQDNFKMEPSVLVTINNPIIDSKKCNSIDLNKKENKIIRSILLKSNHIIYVHDFKENSDIEQFFGKIFSFQQNVDDIFVFNREYDLKFLNFLKNKKIHYYTLLKKQYNQYDLKDDFKAKERFKIVGGYLRCYYTFNTSLIHERKIIIGNLIISPDNAMINLNVDQPTWQITVDNNFTISKKWREKCIRFKKLIAN